LENVIEHCFILAAEKNNSNRTLPKDYGNNHAKLKWKINTSLNNFKEAERG
jgi:hypothetical protein